ncbi:MAG TPA: hypothetical protein VFM14_02870 [Gemmatimonadales bacterium]|nr:hypothetical protein [Gemmatimonadales bacterium]
MVTARIPALLAVLFTGGCYSYQPVQSVLPSPGTRVNLTLTEQAVAEYSHRLGPQATYIEGNIIQADSAGVRLGIVRVEDARRTGTDWRGEEFTFPRESIARMTERRLSVGATAIVGGLALGSVVGAYLAFDLDGEASGVAFPPPQGNQ